MYLNGESTVAKVSSSRGDTFESRRGHDTLVTDGAGTGGVTRPIRELQSLNPASCRGPLALLEASHFSASLSGCTWFRVGLEHHYRAGI